LPFTPREKIARLARIIERRASNEMQEDRTPSTFSRDARDRASLIGPRASAAVLRQFARRSHFFRPLIGAKAAFLRDRRGQWTRNDEIPRGTRSRAHATTWF